VIDKLGRAPSGYADAVLDRIGTTPRDALTGPLPPGFGVMAAIAAPLFRHKATVPELASAMAAEAGEWTWRAALLDAIATNETVIDE
jgi:hypothetical protein